MLITDAQARAHLRIDEGEEISGYIDGAERLAAEFMNRNIYEDQTALDSAIAAIPATLGAAATAYENATDAAALLDPGAVRDTMMLAAQEQFDDVARQSRATALGVVSNDAILSAIKLILGSLYANRENEVVGASVADLSLNAAFLLQPFRKQIGV